uniref:Uncharacterized protein MANES_17G022300 n=1 Tax=Rhizophora mucronata TaxID=61149 RepID=A0A2P2NHV8_RHIMU
MVQVGASLPAIIRATNMYTKRAIYRKLVPEDMIISNDIKEEKKKNQDNDVSVTRI